MQLQLLDLLGYAKQHGLDSEPEHEVGDLQDMFTVAYGLLTPEQRLQFMTTPAIMDLVDTFGKDASVALAETIDELTTAMTARDTTIVIEVEGGVVSDVSNLPEGVSYRIDDHDLTQEVCHGGPCG